MKSRINKTIYIVLVISFAFPSLLHAGLGDLWDGAKKLGNEVYGEIDHAISHNYNELKGEIEAGVQHSKKAVSKMVYKSGGFFQDSFELSRKGLGKVGVHIRPDDKLWVTATTLSNPTTYAKISLELADISPPPDAIVVEHETVSSYVLSMKNTHVNTVIVELDGQKVRLDPSKEGKLSTQNAQPLLVVYIQGPPSQCGYSDNRECWQPLINENISVPNALLVSFNEYNEIGVNLHK